MRPEHLTDSTPQAPAERRIPADLPPMDRPVPTTSALDDRPLAFSRVADGHGITLSAVDRLMEQLPVGVMLVDRDGRPIYANAAARALRVERLEPFQWAVTRALLTEDAVREDEIELVAAGQPRRWLSVQVLPVLAGGVGVSSAIVIVGDVTARTRMTQWTPVIESLMNL